MVSHDVLQTLCTAGLPLLLRYAIDDSSTAVISTALTALHCLLVPDWEEVSGTISLTLYFSHLSSFSHFSRTYWRRCVTLIEVVVYHTLHLVHQEERKGEAEEEKERENEKPS